MRIQKVIKKYYIFHMARGRKRDCRHSITCFSDLDGNKTIGTLYFYKNSATLPENTAHQLYFRSSQFDSVVKTLRVENPVSYFFADSKYCGITTGNESVGEEEGAGA
jgi:hypothetical protein